MKSEDYAVLGLLVALLIGAAFPVTSKGALALGVLLLAIAWISVWDKSKKAP